MCTHRGRLSRWPVPRHIQWLLPANLINAPPRITPIPGNTTTRAALFLTHQAPHNLAPCNPFCSTCSLRVTSRRACLRTQRWNPRSSEVRAAFTHSPNNSRAPSAFPPRRSSTNPEDTCHHPYPHLRCLLYSTMTRLSLLPQGERTRSRLLR